MASPGASSTSSSDFYASEPVASPQETRPTQPENAATATEVLPAANHDPMDGNDTDDSSSEMEMSEPSRPSTPEPLPTASHAGAKRKLSDAAETDGMVAAVLLDDSVKKRKISSTPEQTNGHKSPPPALTPELWQRVFLHLPPAMLCRCLRVCKDFNSYLTSVKSSAARKKDRSIAQLLDSEAIWTQSRKSYFPVIPRPLGGFSERGMLQLIGGRTCQFCARYLSPTPAVSHLNAGPGANGLRVFWPFGIRSCGTCLESRTLKDVQVLSDSRFASLRLGVPHGFLRSPDLNFASDSVRQIPGGIPANLRFSKIYYIPDLEAVKAEEEDAKTLGNGAADEWRKGLAARGKEAMADSARWEKWELQLRPGADLAQVLREYDASSFPRLTGEVQSKPAGVNGTQPSMTVNGAHPLPQPVHVVFQNTHGNAAQPSPQPFPHQQHSRTVRNPQEVELARQARRADIERRCRELEPPLEPNALQHIESFQAAMQIATPMTDSAWEILKPRILAQREAAELYEHERALSEHERASQLAALRATLPTTSSDELVPKPAKETYDKEYELAQEPLRKRLGEYADDYVNGQWSGGKLLDRDNAPIFAIHVIMHVRRRYVEDKQLGLLPRFEPPRRKEGPKHSTPPPESFLSLDNMKWVHDKKVRPLTDVHRRELFICAGCAEEKKPKWFAFEGLIQHYGAKHTHAFSKDNIVVHWQTAEWPEEPPFHQNPAHWLRLDRRTSELKSHTRPRNTPHNNNGPFPTPPVSHPPQIPYHPTNNVAAVAHPGYPPGHFVSPSSQGPQNGFFHPQAPPEPRADVNHEAQVNTFSSDSREVWDSLDGIKDLEGSIRIQTTIHHAVSRFAERFQMRPPLDLLTDALATNTLMRPLRNAHGLACKSCIASNSNGTSTKGSYWVRIRGAKLYNTSSLITHYKLIHLPQKHSGFFDWTRDMVELPDNNIVRDLLRTPGMDDDKLKIIALAFPTAFPTPLPKIGMVSEEGAAPASAGLTNTLLERLNKKPKNQGKKKGQKAAANGHSEHDQERDESLEPLPEPTEDEYDPRRPMFVKPKEPALDASQLDTDARKAVPAAQPPSTGFSLDPETLAALQTLSAATGIPHMPVQSHVRSFSPSVGAQAPLFRTDASASTATPTSQPDIAAILASLTGHAPAAQTATPPSAAGERADSAPRQLRDDPLGKAQPGSPTVYYGEDRRSSGRQHARDPAPFSLVHDIPAALSHNSENFQQNRQHAYVEASYAHAPAQHSASQYHYAYEGSRHYGHPHQQQQQPVYREAAVQYIQLPEREQTHHGYQHERAPPNPIYVDQYGRPLELIPIDAAPAPVQYAPTQYEQSYQPVYTAVASTAHLQPVYDDRRPTYYTPTNGVHQRYGYDDGRASVPRS